MPEKYDRDDLGSVRASRKRITRKIKLHQKALVKLRQLRAKRTKRIRLLKKRRDPAAKAVKFLVDRYGRTENNNRAPWLDRWARLIGEWMVGQPWCGLAVWMAARHAGTVLDKRTVSTVFIRDAAIKGQGGFKAWHGPNVTPKLGWVAVYGTSSGPQHTGMYAGKGIVAEGNTSPGSGGSQANGGGLYPRTLSSRRGWLLGYAEIDWKE